MTGKRKRKRTDRTRQLERERQAKRRLAEKGGVGNLTLPNVNYAELGDLLRQAEMLPDRSDNDRATLVYGVFEVFEVIRKLVRGDIE
jgi:hypothetical protein